MNHGPRILIVDDEAPARMRMRQLLGDIASDVPHTLVGEVENGRKALELITTDDAVEGGGTSNVDVVLLDVQMPGMNGIQLARHLGGMAAPPVIVFITAFDEYAVKAFELHAIDYLMKPVRAQRLRDALQRAGQRLQQRAMAQPASSHTSQASAPTGTFAASQQAAIEQLAKADAPQGREHIVVHERGRMLLVPVADIVYLKAELKYVTVRTPQREYLIEESLVALEQEFAQRMVRVHRNALVARKAIIGFERSENIADGDSNTEPNWQVLLQGIPERLPVSRRQWPVIKALMK